MDSIGIVCQLEKDVEYHRVNLDAYLQEQRKNIDFKTLQLCVLKNCQTIDQVRNMIYLLEKRGEEIERGDKIWLQ